MWDKDSETWDVEANPWFLNGVLYQRFFLPICFQNDSSKKVDIILDFGCATGTLSDYMRDHATKVIAFDISPKMIEKVRANNWDNVEAVAGCLADTEDPVIRQLTGDVPKQGGPHCFHYGLAVRSSSSAKSHLSCFSRSAEGRHR